MISTNRATISLAAAALFFVGCNRDAQTEGQVTTKTGAGEVSTSLSGDSADKRGEALVRIVNAASTSGGLIVRSDETHALPSVEYRKVTPYQSIDRNWVTFQVSSQPSGSYVPLATDREMLTDGYRYSMILMPGKDGTGLETRVLRDEISSDVTRAHLRIVHAAQGVGEVNVVARGKDKVFEGVNFTSEAGFKDMDPWTGTLEFRSEDGNRLLKAMPNVNLEAGKSYTIVLTRDAKGKVDAFWFVDEQVN